MVKTASVIDFVFRRANEDVSVPFVVEIPDVADGDVDAFVFSAFDKDRKTVMVSAYVDKTDEIKKAEQVRNNLFGCLYAIIIPFFSDNFSR